MAETENTTAQPIDQSGSANTMSDKVVAVDQPKVGDAPKASELQPNQKRADVVSFGDLVRHSSEIDAQILIANRPKDAAPAPKPGDRAEIDAQTVYLGINEKPHDNVGSTKDLTGKPLVQADGGHSGPGTATYVGNAMTAIEGGKVGIVAPATAPVADPAAAGWQSASPKQTV